MSPVLLIFVLATLNTTTALPPACEYKDLPTPLTRYSDWSRTFLDTLYKLPETYVPPDLVPVSEAGVGTSSILVRDLLMNDLKALLKAANTSSIKLEVQSAYRSYEYQEQVFTSWVTQDGYEETLTSSARPGHSEHQLGTALDFRSAGRGSSPAWEQDDWGETPEGEWLAENAFRFGFIMSYPEARQELTCYIYEPWHYRYVGVETAVNIQKSGMTLREWLWVSSQQNQ